MKIALIPIDNRPVCYNLAKEIAAIDNDLELFLPDRALLGGLSSDADVDGIFDWLDELDKVDAIIISLDTIAYGGLISSRRCKDSIDEIKEKLDRFKVKLKGKGKVYAFSSIMRISNNNVSEEEKEYWSEYGEKIFEYSYKFHKEGLDLTEVPQEIINDYLATRHRNFTVNKMYLQWLEDEVFDTLVYSKDDCSEFGFNVLESEILIKMIKERNLPTPKKSVFIKTGADEIPLTLFARAICNFNKVRPKIFPIFLAPQHKNLISNYEDISIEKSVQAQIELAGALISEENNSNLVLLVNNFEENQGEIVMGIKTKPFNEKLDLPRIPFIIADVRFANGGDNKFVEKLFKIFDKKNGSNAGFDFSDFYGYSAWNTSANTLGSLLCAAVVKFFANSYNEDAFKKLQTIRFLDDWAYQANVRQILRGKPLAIISEGETVTLKPAPRPDIKKLKKLMQPFEKKINKIFKLNFVTKYKFPWKRFFEIEIIIK